MNSLRKLACVLPISMSSLLALSGCEQQSAESEPIESAQIRQIAELSTLKCYYHNVAKFTQEAGGMGWLGGMGYKRMWFEYTAIVEIGINVNEISITGPDENGVYTVTLPEAEVLTNPQIDEGSIIEPLTEQGWFTEITNEDRMTALRDAQETVRETVNNDDSLLFQARERAKELIERYIVNYGETVGEEYSVRFVDPEE